MKNYNNFKLYEYWHFKIIPLLLITIILFSHWKKSKSNIIINPTLTPNFHQILQKNQPQYHLKNPSTPLKKNSVITKVVFVSPHIHGDGSRAVRLASVTTAIEQFPLFLLRSRVLELVSDSWIHGLVLPVVWCRLGCLEARPTTDNDVNLSP